MDGHAGKDLIIKVPCGTLVWLLKDTTPPRKPKCTEDDDEEEESRSARPMFAASTSHRPVIRSSSGAMAQEIDFSAETRSAVRR